MGFAGIKSFKRQLRGLERACVLSRFSLPGPVKATRPVVPVVSSTQFVAVCYGTELFHFSEPFQHFLAFIISPSYRRRNVVQRGHGQAKVTLVPVFSAVMITKLPAVRKGAGCGQTGRGRRGWQGPRGTASPAGGQGVLAGGRLLQCSFIRLDTGLI